MESLERLRQLIVNPMVDFESNEEMVDTVQALVDEACKTGNVQVSSFAGILDIMAFPDGTFSFVDTTNCKRFKISSEGYKEILKVTI